MARGGIDTPLADASPSSQLDALKQANAALEQQLRAMRGLAFRDQLTGLYSRRYLTDFLQQEIEQFSTESNVELALCDIDDFKAINDVRGHQSGDIAIVCIADILDDLAGGQPVIRWGGEELLVVMFSTPEHEAIHLCEEMRRQVSAYRIDDGAGEFTCTLTFGIGSYDASATFDENFARIDRALYRGKETGKNRCILARRDAGCAES